MGKIYVLTNPAMPEYIKIGKTDQDDIRERVRQLDTTGVPLPFEVAFAAEVTDYDRVEKLLFQVFANERVRPNREFFTVSPERVVAAIKIDPTHRQIMIDEHVGVEPQDQNAVERAIRRQQNFNFDMVQIPIGSVLRFTRDENIVCTVVNGTNVVEYNGERTSLSDAALKALHSIGTNWLSARGPVFWKYEDEILIDRRNRYENNEE